MSQPEKPLPYSSIRKQSAVNEIQRRILLAGAVLAMLALLFPPWSFSGGSWGGYHFIVSPPAPSSTVAARRPSRNEQPDDPGSHINSSLLFIELVALGLIAWFSFVAARNVTAKRLSKVALLVIASSVVLVAVLFAWFVWPKSYTEETSVRTTRLTGTRYVWSEKRGWITEAEKKAEDLADDIQRRNTAKPVLDDLRRVVVERDDGDADTLSIHNPTHWSLPYADCKLTVEYYRQKGSGLMLLKIAQSQLEIAPGLNDVHLNDPSNFVGTEPLLEKIRITANSARNVGGEVSPTALIPPFTFEHERTCQTEYTKSATPENIYLENPYLGEKSNYTSKVVCRRYK